MHLLIATRGHNRYRDLWVKTMEGQPFLWNRKNLKTNKEETHLFTGALQPIELWTYIFPEEHLEEVLNAMDVVDPEGNVITHPSPSWGIIRKATGFKKLPKVKKMNVNRIMNIPLFSSNVIGYKKDNRVKWKEAGYEQEML